MSYSHLDEDWKDLICGHLAVLELDGVLDIWNSERVAAGSWRFQIEAALDRAVVAVLLISADYLTSNFIRGTEIPRLLARRQSAGVRLIPVFVRPCPWKAVGWLAATEGRPRGDRALSELRKPQVARHLADLTMEIRDLLAAPGPGQQVFDAGPKDQLNLDRVVTIDDQIKRYLARHPEKVYQLSPRKFEELVADILEDLGFECELTPATRDGGCDIYAYVRTQVTSFLMFVECKRYHPSRKIGIEIVQRVHGAASAAGAHKGMVVTTSFFTQPAILEQRRICNRFDLADFTVLSSWLGRFNAT